MNGLNVYIDWGIPAPAVFIGTFDKEAGTLSGRITGAKLERALSYAFPAAAWGMTDVYHKGDQTTARVCVTGPGVDQNLSGMFRCMSTSVPGDDRVFICTAQPRTVTPLEKDMITLLPRIILWPSELVDSFLGSTQWDWLSHSKRKPKEEA